MGKRRISVRGSLDELYGKPKSKSPAGGNGSGVEQKEIAPASQATTRYSDMSLKPGGDTAPSLQVAEKPVSNVEEKQVSQDVANLSPSRHSDKAPKSHDHSSATKKPVVGKLVKKDFYITPGQDVEIDQLCTTLKIRTGRNVARSEVVRDALEHYFKLISADGHSQ